MENEKSKTEKNGNKKEDPSITPSEQGTKGEKRFKRPSAQTVTNIVLAVATIGLLYMTYRLANETRDMGIATKNSASATKDMAKIMKRDFILRSTPIFYPNTPIISKMDSGFNIETKISMKSQGIAKDAVHYQIYQFKNGEYKLDKSGVLKSNGFESKMYEVPRNYNPNTYTSIISRIQSFKLEDLKNLFIVIRYKTLFDQKEKYECFGYVIELSILEKDRIHAEAMPKPLLDNHKSKINEQNILGFQIPLE